MRRSADLVVVPNWRSVTRDARVAGDRPATWLIHQRVVRAQQLLESSGPPIDEIA